MSDLGSVSIWLSHLKAGDRAALRPLWERYFSRLVALARQRLKGRAVGGADAEDVALSAFDSLYRGAQRGRFPRLEDRDDLWQVLILLARQKAADLVEAEGRQKRGGGKVLPASALAGDGPAEDVFAAVFGPEPTPEFAADVAEQCRLRLDALPEDLRRVALWKMEGYTNEEIGEKLGRSVATVERKLALIRKTWAPETA
jgi:DNA-directed RNA polymerase specialized sigma24 family protein